jgi:hypothetical protein
MMEQFIIGAVFFSLAMGCLSALWGMSAKTRSERIVCGFSAALLLGLATLLMVVELAGLESTLLRAFGG